MASKAAAAVAEQQAAAAALVDRENAAAVALTECKPHAWKHYTLSLAYTFHRLDLMHR